MKSNSSNKNHLVLYAFPAFTGVVSANQFIKAKKASSLEEAYYTVKNDLRTLESNFRSSMGSVEETQTDDSAYTSFMDQRNDLQSQIAVLDKQLSTYDHSSSYLFTGSLSLMATIGMVVAAQYVLGGKIKKQLFNAK